MADLWQWEQESPQRLLRTPRPAAAGRTEPSAAATATPPAARDVRPRHDWLTWATALRGRMAKPARFVPLAAMVLTLGAAAMLGSPDGVTPEERLLAIEGMLRAREGELASTRLAADRLGRIVELSGRYGIPADLAAAIHDIAAAEGIEPALAFALVRVESGFVATAVSSAGAVGLTQIMPSTARELQPGLDYLDLFDRDTNLRLGFRYLRRLVDHYQGDLRTALLAYNRGPARVAGIRAGGGDPGNGYATDVMTRARAQ